MSLLIPKHDYFKHSTRSLLTEQEKQQIIAAVDRTVRYLSNQSSISRFEDRTSANGRIEMRNLRDSMKYFSRLVSLVKGSTQPRHLYRRERRLEIALEAVKISTKTGADFSEVFHLFTLRMDRYVSEHP